MMWANLSQAERITYLEAIVRQALQSKALLAEVADAIYALSQQSELSADEQRLLNILNDAINQEEILPASAPNPAGEPTLKCAPQTQTVHPGHSA